MSIVFNQLYKISNTLSLSVLVEIIGLFSDNPKSLRSRLFTISWTLNDGDLFQSPK